jgi:hypothetical protein
MSDPIQSATLPANPDRSDPARTDPASGGTTRLARRHVKLGWWLLLVFLLLGAVLEALHGFKIGWYVDAASETRRLVWRLAHAHGTLLSLVNVAFGLTLQGFAAPEATWPRRASRALVAGTLLLPGGFFLGGFLTYGGDPWFGVFLVPLGALALVVAVFTTARGVSGGAKG